MNQIDLIHTIIGIFGIGLILNAFIIIASSKYYSFFSKTYFIEPASDLEKEKIGRKIREGDYNGQRYVSSVISIGLGVGAVSWAFGAIKSVSSTFFILAGVAFAVGIFKFITKK